MDAFLNALDRPFDFSQADLGNITCGSSENVYGRRGIELMHPLKHFFSNEIVGGISETGKHRVSNACLYGQKKSDAEVIFVILLKKAPFLFVRQLLQIIRNIVRTEIDGGSNHRIGNSFFRLIFVNKPIL